MDEKKLKALLSRYEDLIWQHGFMVQSVLPTDGDEPQPAFFYTVGLHDKGLPELIAFGLDLRSGQCLLNDMAEVLLQRQAAQEPLVGIVNHADWPMPVWLRDADCQRAGDWALGASRRSGGAAVYLQVVWPDREGRFPWDARYDRQFDAAQPLLLPRAAN